MDSFPATGKIRNGPSWLSLFGYSSALSILFLCVCLYPAGQGLLLRYHGHKVLESVLGDSGQWSMVLVRDLAQFSIVVISLHLLMAILVLMFTWITYRALPGIRSSRRSVLTLWWIAAAVALVLMSAARFPESHLGLYYHSWASHEIGALSVAQLFFYGFGICVAGLLAAACWRGQCHRRSPRHYAMVALGSVVMASVLSAGSTHVVQPASEQPNIILVGVDSLRTDVLAAFGSNRRLAPALDAELSHAYLFKDATTPLARTFPSWLSVLTGRHPRDTGAWVNLMPRSRVSASPTLAELLRERGYRTIYATDEVRFANIDQSYGFDQVITPRIGAADFLLGTFNDMPVPNLLSNYRIAKYLFPHTHTNRAAAATYSPEAFVRRVGNDADFSVPTFMAIHFTMSHWPYFAASRFDQLSHDDDPDDSFGEEDLSAYAESVRIADWQVKEFLDDLRTKGVLDNAIVVFLSDHGEALRRTEDRLIKTDAEVGGVRLFETGEAGHGTSVLSPAQFQVLMAFRAYGRAADLFPSGSSNSPASLEDIAPTVLDLLNLQHSSATFTGISLAELMRGTENASQFDERVRFTETDFNLPRIVAGEINPGWLAMQAASYYQVASHSGWVEMREDQLDRVLEQKEIAAIGTDWLLAALPTLGQRERWYVFANRHTGEYEILEHAPDTNVVAMQLWKELHRRFPQESLAPRQISPKTTSTVE